MIYIRVVGGLARRSLAVGLLSVAAALAGCRGSSEPLGPTATVPQATTTTNPYAVPAVIDVTYVNRVLAGLDQALGDVLRMVVDAKKISDEAVDRLEALYVGDYLTLTIGSLQKSLLGDFKGYEVPPGNQVTTAVELITVGPQCIFARVDRDFSAVSTRKDAPVLTQWVALVPRDPLRGPNHLNSTSWMFIYDGFPADHSQPENPCESAS
jgi:hypothetical protein